MSRYEPERGFAVPLSVTAIFLLPLSFKDTLPASPTRTCKHFERYVHLGSARKKVHRALERVRVTAVVGRPSTEQVLRTALAVL